ncbi:hypothetical protein ILP92_11555 [Maribius pontilimi]|uniref:Secreted protein n=1 Tax=Palleronia pontilimi TaxID=1964209 RepID=A0A934MEE6_9RHOB|nr:hypothetical protein [Palleronia pontilimi]MBJ3763381.1 hypothetical protein [Palleronia pontilimi]
MRRFILLATAGACLLPGLAGIARAADVTADELMDRLKGVAPEAVLEYATLLHIPAEGDPQVVQEGTNGWTCMYPGTDPMCADAQAVSWAQAFMGQTEPPETVGFIYMLLGDEGASNIDPYAAGETADNQWVQTGPHVMIVGAGARPLYDTYPQTVPDEAGLPWVMWPDTPYAHLMIPVE